MADTVNLHKSYSKLNESLTHQFDASGVRRSFTVPYIEGQPMADHINAVGQAASQAGGLSGNLITTAHHSGGKGWGSGEGHTVGHPSAKLRNTIIPKDDEHAKASIAAAQQHLNNIEKLLGDKEPSVVTANSQLALVKKTDGAGMNLADFGMMLIQIMHKPMQAMARAVSNAHSQGPAPHLRAPEPRSVQEGTQESQGEAQGGGETSEAQPAVAAAPGASAASAAAPIAASAPQQAQG